MKEVVEAANKNIKRILRKIVDNSHIGMKIYPLQYWGITLQSEHPQGLHLIF